MTGFSRRSFLLLLGAAAVPARAQFQQQSVEPLVREITGGKTVRKGRVKLELPQLAENGNSVALKVSVDSPMSASDHVRAIHLLSDRNPVPRIATFHLGPRVARAQVGSRVRLAGSQRVLALAEMADGSFWSDSADVIVTLSACVDGTG